MPEPVGLPLTYLDQGCNLAPSCLHCPFVLCQFDLPKDPRLELDPPEPRRNHKLWLRALNDYELIDPQASPQDVGRQFHLSEEAGRVLQRAAAWITVEVLARQRSVA